MGVIFPVAHAQLLSACKIYFKRRFVEARVRISGGERGRDRERWMRKRKSEIRRERKENQGLEEKYNVTAVLIDRLQVCI